MKVTLMVAMPTAATIPPTSLASRSPWPQVLPNKHTVGVMLLFVVVVVCFQVYCGVGDGVEVGVHVTQYECGGLTPDTNYTVGVTARNSAGEGTPRYANASTSCSPLSLDTSTDSTILTLPTSPCSLR